MATLQFQLPIKGKSEGFPLDKSPALTSGHLNNVRPTDVLEKRLRIGQRPGLTKVYTQQISGDNSIVELTQVTILD